MKVPGKAIPIALTLHTTAGNLKQAARAVPAHYLVQHASRTPDLVAVFAVEKMLQGI